jgi:ribonuclease-3
MEAVPYEFRELLTLLADRIGLKIRNEPLALTALTHKSFVNEQRDKVGTDNERLEFLGDAVVDLAVGHRLMERYPDAKEGELSKMRALIVNEEGLARVARRLSLGGLLRLGRGEELTGGRDKNSVLADALEAVLGAVYLSEGLEKALGIVDTHFAEAIDQVKQGGVGDDFKTRLQEIAQERFRLSPRYRTVSEEGPHHEKVFCVEVRIGTDWVGKASGRSKKEAEQAAAAEALSKLTALDSPQAPE